MDERTTLLEDDQGLTTVEYVIILVLIAVLGLAAWENFGQAVEFGSRTATGSVNTLGTGS